GTSVGDASKSAKSLGTNAVGVKALLRVQLAVSSDQALDESALKGGLSPLGAVAVRGAAVLNRQSRLRPRRSAMLTMVAVGVRQRVPRLPLEATLGLIKVLSSQQSK